jgi:MFS family permease
MSGRTRSLLRRSAGRWRAYPRDYRRFCWIVFVAGVGYGFVDILVPLYGQALGVSNLAIGVLFAVFSVPKAVISPVIGVISDRMGHRRTIVAGGFVLAGLLYAVVPLIGLVTAFVAIRFLLGGIDAAIRPTARTLISETGGEEGRGQSFGLYSSFRTFGTVAGPILAGAIIAWSGFVLSFATTGLVFVAAGLLTSRFVSRDFGPADAGLTLREAVTSIRESVAGVGFRLPAAFVVFYLVVFLRFVGLHAYVRFLPLYLESVGYGPGLVGLLFSVRTLSAAVCFPLGGIASDRFGRLPILGLGVLLSGLAPFALYFQASTAWVVTALLIAGVGRALFIPTLPAYVSDITTETERGTQLGGVSAVSSLAVGTAPLAAGALGDAFGIATILVFSAATLGLGTLLVIPLAALRH